ncbi:MAG TPA: hypothetical protein VKD22_05095 [Ramlibacter sp.]|nr:hypothetical protein [Ramlibacter sp.]
MGPNKNRSEQGQQPPNEPYVRGDPIPTPDAEERNTDSVWDLWHRTHRAHEVGYAQTAPGAVAPADAGAFAPTQPVGIARAPLPPPTRAPKALTLQDAMVEARRNNRVCPKPARWTELYELLPNRTATQPTPPLLGAAWNATPSLSKRMCLREHLAWAEAKGALPTVLAFLKQLPEQEWLHMGD